ncbi:AprI/Inh family metalloprotease inhibitor [Bartonella sp. B17]
MTFSKKLLFIVLSVITILSGCSTQRFNNNGKGGIRGIFYPVQNQKMSTFEVMADPEIPNSLEFEEADSAMYDKGDSRSDEFVTNLELPNGSVDLFPASIAGVWNISGAGKTCRIATPQTKFGQGYRAAPLGCSGVASRIKSWAVKGKKLYFYDKSGRTVVVLYSSNLNHFKGITFDNHPVFLNR